MKKYAHTERILLAGLTYIPLEPLPGGTKENYSSLPAYLNLLFNILLSIGAMIAVVTLVLGGITYMVSEVVDKKSEAKKRMQAAIIGLLILLGCWLILYTINPNLTRLSVPGLENAPGAPASPGGASPSSDAAQPSQAQSSSCEKSGGTVQYTEAGWFCQK